MSLKPLKPPGRLNRKALAFGPEICRLHAAGHTCEAIRLALLEAGVKVSRSTVHRELTKPGSRAQFAPVAFVDPVASEPRTWLTPAIGSSSAFANDPRSAKEIAAAFVAGRITNPLLRSRSTHEGSSH